MSIRARLLLLVFLVTFLPSVLIGAHLEVQREDELAVARNDLSIIAQSALRDLNERIRGTAQLLYALARSRDLGDDRAACSVLLADVLKLHPQYTGLLTINPSGELFCDSLHSGRSLDLNDRAYFRQSLVSDGEIVLEPAFGRLTGIPVLQIAYPQRDAAGGLTVVLLASLNLAHYAYAVVSGLPVSRPDFVLMDRAGLVFAWHSAADRKRLVGTSIASSPLYSLAREQAAGGTGEAADPDGKSRVWAVSLLSGVGDTGLYMMVGIPRSELTWAADRDLGRSVALLVATSVLAFLGAWLVVEYGVRRPVKRIVEVVDRLSAGELDARTAQPHPRGELGNLMTALDRTAESLERQQRNVVSLNQRLSTLIEHLPLGVSLVDRDLRVLACNDRFFELLDLPRGELKVGDSIAKFVRYSAERGEFGPVDIDSFVPQLIARAQSPAGDQMEYQRPSGQVLIFDRVPLPEGGFVTTYTDVTERRAMEAQLIQSQKMEAVGQLTGGLAHDFNNMLTVVIGGLDLLLEDAAETGASLPYADSALEAALRSAGLVRQLLAFSRKQPLRSRVLDLGAILQKTKPLLRGALGDHITLAFPAVAGLWPILADPAQFESAVLNLAINARDAMPEGGRLTITCANVTLDDDGTPATELPAGDYVVLIVADTGAGIAPEVLARVFEPFFTTKEIGRGTGLGLSMVYGYARQSGGAVRIYSEVGRGTDVRLYLPRATDDGDAMPVASPQVGMPTGNERILLVDDKADVRGVAVAMLRGLGYRVTDAASPAAALALLDGGEHFDLLFTDIVMPGALDGVALAHEMRRRLPGLPVLFTSGFADPGAIGEAMQALGAALLVKPYRKTDLAAHVRSALDARTLPSS